MAETKTSKKDNPMLNVRIAKVTLNFGAGTDQPLLEKGKKLLEMITGVAPVTTKTNKRIPSWGLRPGLPVGAKITLRGEQAVEVLQRMLKACDDKLAASCFDNNGTISFGVKEYIDIPGVKYDQKIGIIGLQATVTLERPGYRVKRRRLQSARIRGHHNVNKQDAIAFAQNTLKIQVE